MVNPLLYPRSNVLMISQGQSSERGQVVPNFRFVTVCYGDERGRFPHRCATVSTVIFPHSVHTSSVFLSCHPGNYLYTLMLIFTWGGLWFVNFSHFLKKLNLTRPVRQVVFLPFAKTIQNLETWTGVSCNRQTFKTNRLIHPVLRRLAWWMWLSVLIMLR